MLIVMALVTTFIAPLLVWICPLRPSRQEAAANRSGV